MSNGDANEENYPLLKRPKYSNIHSTIEIAEGW